MSSGYINLPVEGGGGGSGTVTSVAMTVPSILSVAGSPITTSGTLALTLVAQAANKVFAGPTTGANAAPTFRSLVAADIPALALTSAHIFVGNGSNVATDVAVSGDLTLANTGAFTLNTVNSNVGSFGSASQVSALTVNAKGLVTAAASTSIQIAESQVTNLVSDLAGKQAVGNYITALTGDGTASGPGSVALTLATVNSNVGAFGSASSVATFTVNAKGLTTAAGSTSIQIAESQVTNLVSDLATKITDPMTTIGDMIYRNGSNVTARLPIGSTNQVLKTSGGVPTWADPISVWFGDGSDGSATITSGTTTLTNNTYYDILTISGTGSVNTGNYMLFCKTLDLSNAPANAITFSGAAGASSTATAGGAAGGNTSSTYFANTANGGAGGASSTTTGAQGSAGQAASPGNGGAGGLGEAGGSGASGAQAGGTSRAGGASSNPVKYAAPTLVFQRNTSQLLAGAGGSGGGGGGGSGTLAGTGGGAGGSGGGFMTVFAQTIITTGSTAAGAITSKGGNGGNSATASNANAGSGGGGGGGGGGYIIIVYQTKTGGAVTNLVDASGGTGGNSGNANGNGLAGNAGTGGSSGRIDIINISTQTGTHVTSSAGSAGGSGSGTTGASGGAAGVSQASL